MAGILRSKLGREGYAVEWRRDRAGALEALGASGFDLILLSTYLLPDRDAWSLLEDVRRHPAHGGVPVLMLLEAEEAGLRERALASGAAGVILKPFKPTQVAKILRGLLPIV